MSPILPSDVEFALDAEAFVCVPITDYEAGQATLEYIRAASDGVILLDGHARPAPSRSAGSASTACGPSATRGCPASTSSR